MKSRVCMMTVVVIVAVFGLYSESGYTNIPDSEVAQLWDTERALFDYYTAVSRMRRGLADLNLDYAEGNVSSWEIIRQTRTIEQEIVVLRRELESVIDSLFEFSGQALSKPSYKAWVHARSAASRLHSGTHLLVLVANGLGDLAEYTLFTEEWRLRFEAILLRLDLTELTLAVADLHLMMLRESYP